MTGESVETVLNQELDRLPDKLRAPLILHYMMGETHASAAQKLNIPAGSMARRLHIAKRKLQIALRKRGIAAPLSVVAWLLMQFNASASVPRGLIEATLVAAQAKTAAASVAGFRGIQTAVWWQHSRSTWLATTLLLCLVASIVFWFRWPSVGVAANLRRHSVQAIHPPQEAVSALDLIPTRQLPIDLKVNHLCGPD